MSCKSYLRSLNQAVVLLYLSVVTVQSSYLLVLEDQSLGHTAEVALPKTDGKIVKL
jgi:hypothetical protein